MQKTITAARIDAANMRGAKKFLRPFLGAPRTTMFE